MQHIYTEGDPFNPSFYHPGTDTHYLGKFRFDLATAQIEHGTHNPTRVVPFEEYLDLTTGKVYSADPQYGFSEVVNQPSDPLSVGTANLFSIFKAVDQYPGPIHHVIHLSPPDPAVGFKSGRITLYEAALASNNLIHVQGYGSLGCELTYSQHLTIARRLTGANFSSPQQLRDFPLSLDLQNEDLFTYLAKVAPELAPDLSAISSGLAHRFFAEVLAETNQISESSIRRAIATGVLGIAKDVDFSDTQCPTTSTLSLSSSLTETPAFATRLSIPYQGREIYVNGTKYVWVQRCGACSCHIGAYLAAHYRCTCGGVYQGC